MRYISTRGKTEEQSFCQAVIMGLANDGGLLIPKNIPTITDNLNAWRTLDYADIAFNVMSLFIDDIPSNDLKTIVSNSVAHFEHKDITPIVKLKDVSILELFHGPTLAFKDVALQFLGNTFEYILKRDGGKLNILGATSGDTGSAAIQGVRGKDNINIFIMHPNGRTSPLQALQMISVLDNNVHNLAVDGSFDDCQHIMKTIFNDLEFKKTHHLGAINSVNWARILAQVVYYVYASLKQTSADHHKVSFAVPTGNFGDIFAGYIAKRMGCPIDKLILATNENNILSTFFNTGLYKKGEVHQTISPSMDIQIASNFERYLYFHTGENPAQTTQLIQEFIEKGEVQLPCGTNGIDSDFIAASANTEETLNKIKEIYQQEQYLLDPHTATSLVAAKKATKNSSPSICLATAHPAKFPDAIKDALGKDLAKHTSLETLKGLETRCTNIVNDVEAVKNFLKDKLN